MPIAIAIGAAAVIGGGASIIASNKASKTAKQINTTNNAVAADVRNDNTALLAPYVEAGNKATNSIQALLGLGGDKAATDAAFQNWRDSTGYQFQFNEGQKAVEAGLGKKGYSESGAAKKALTQYGQNAASGSFGNYYGALTGQQGVGLSAANTNATTNMNFGNNVQANNTAAGNVQANAALANGGAINGIVQNGLSAFALSQGLQSSYGGGGFNASGLDPSSLAGRLPYG